MASRLIFNFHSKLILTLLTLKLNICIRKTAALNAASYIGIMVAF